jgi:hypothetical protein
MNQISIASTFYRSFTLKIRSLLVINGACTYKRPFLWLLELVSKRYHSYYSWGQCLQENVLVIPGACAYKGPFLWHLGSELTSDDSCYPRARANKIQILLLIGPMPTSNHFCYSWGLCLLAVLGLKSKLDFVKMIFGKQLVHEQKDFARYTFNKSMLTHTWLVN